jgi:hypothetical protein
MDEFVIMIALQARDDDGTCQPVGSYAVSQNPVNYVDLSLRNAIVR